MLERGAGLVFIFLLEEWFDVKIQMPDIKDQSKDTYTRPDKLSINVGW